MNLIMGTLNVRRSLTLISDGCTDLLCLKYQHVLHHRHLPKLILQHRITSA